jgi:F0F1-type ATP synthase epsilon subunit
MREPFHLKVLTPERTLLEAEGVTQVRARLADGGPIGIYPGHAPLLAETVAAPLRYADASGEHAIDLNAGILQIKSTDVTIFTDSAKPEAELESLQDPEDDRHFDQLAQELMTTLAAQPDEALNGEYDHADQDNQRADSVL